jgi:flagellar FliL protein
MIIVVLQFVTIIGLISLYFGFLKPGDGGANENIAGEEIDAKDNEKQPGQEEEPLENERPLGAIVPLDTLILNLRDSGFLKIRIQLEFIEREVPSRYYSREVVLRDSVIALLNTKTKDELLSSRGKDNLRSEIKELMNEALKKALIEHVYFSEYVIR